MDLWLAEKHLDGSNIGPTFACLLAAIRDGDQFWWENPKIFTNKQQKTLVKVTLSKVMCESAEGIKSIQPNAFKLSKSHVQCRSLPKLDLSKWKDCCYYY